MPTAFLLPEEYSKFATHIRKTAASEIWALKEDVHRGKGVVAASGFTALRQSLDKLPIQPTKGSHSPPTTKANFVMAQRFIDDQFLINNRPFVMRLWAVFSGGNPVFRSYLYDGGLAIFGSEQQQQQQQPSVDVEEAQSNSGSTTATTATKHSQQQQQQQQDRAQSLIVNIFQQNRSEAIDPWAMTHLKAHMKSTTGSDDAFNDMWEVIKRSSAAALAAAVPSVRRATSRYKLPRFQGGNIEVLGIDFVVDAAMRPWLVEVNYLPSMARKIIDCVPDGGGGNSTVDVESSSSGGGSSGTTTAATTKTVSKTGNIPCIENPMDAEKESFLRAHLNVIAARHTTLEAHSTTAAAALQKYVEALGGQRKTCSVTQELLQQLLTAEIERRTAMEQRFSDLTPRVYTLLESCMSSLSRKQNNSTTCESSLPLAAPDAADRAPPPLLQKMKAWVAWGMAQVRRLILALADVLEGLEQKGKWRSRRIASRPRYRTLPSDVLVAAWLKLSLDERQGNAETVLAKLCALETELNKKKEDKENENKRKAAAAAHEEL